ncbi:LETM1 and EF-hand domain-containing protein 1, mitochondrial [Entomortierella parvispora]|uniref:LETM1 and EF-hand domain-containing protein 1, mitochondrial n=1 Tax=Entomortierella parvispora TaxID=205924 RepID=A0A9P3H2V1_9FUNG|nr:LETM1 and EF-hand domain-containing protein 1, mitochondrial [Entomortierella parvispora]
MSATVIRAATSLGLHANARSLSSITQSGHYLTRHMIMQRQFAARHASATSAFSRSTFYSTMPSTKSNDQVQPSPAPMEDLTGAIKAGTAGSVAPEDSLSSASTTAIDTKPPAGLSGKITEFVRKGKEIVIQCKDGVKLLWVNKKIVKDLKQAQLQDGHQLTRREFQLIHKTDIDVKRMIPFGLIFLLATEYIPLIIIFAPQLIPSTCVTPSQLDGRRKKIHEKRSTMTEKLILQNKREITKEHLASYNSFISIAKKYGEGFDYNMIDRQHLSSFCKFMGLSGFGPKFMLKKRLDKHMTYLHKDDVLLHQEGLDSLTFSELQVANEERGMRSLEVSREHLEKSLAYWLRVSQSKDAQVPPALMIFSRMFLLHSTFKSDPARK